MATDLATEKNFNKVYPQRAQARFWKRVKRTLSDVFATSPDVAEAYRHRVEAASVAERMLVYHEEPLKIAADLAGVKDISDEQLRIYRELAESDASSRRRLSSPA